MKNVIMLVLLMLAVCAAVSFRGCMKSRTSRGDVIDIPAAPRGT
jgi:hypothetical protein